MLGTVPAITPTYRRFFVLNGPALTCYTSQVDWENGEEPKLKARSRDEPLRSLAWILPPTTRDGTHVWGTGSSLAGLCSGRSEHIQGPPNSR